MWVNQIDGWIPSNTRAGPASRDLLRQRLPAEAPDGQWSVTLGQLAFILADDDLAETIRVN